MGIPRPGTTCSVISFDGSFGVAKLNKLFYFSSGSNSEDKASRTYERRLRSVAPMLRVIYVQVLRVV